MLPGLLFLMRGGAIGTFPAGGWRVDGNANPDDPGMVAMAKILYAWCPGLAGADLIPIGIRVSPEKISPETSPLLAVFMREVDREKRKRSAHLAGLGGLPLPKER